MAKSVIFVQIQAYFSLSLPAFKRLRVFEVVALVSFVLIRARGLLGVGPRRLVFSRAAGAGSEANAVREETQGDHAAEDLLHPAGDDAGQRRGGAAQLSQLV